MYKIITENGEILAKISGKLSYSLNSITDYPVIGDWVLVDRTTDVNGKTIAFIGLSGVGKSILINKFVGKDFLRTNSIGNDGKGKHTTTHRELILILGGGVLIDTPGMRELGLISADLDKSFSDIEESKLDVKRLENYKKLQRELKYSELNSKELEREKINKMFGSIGSMKETKKFIKRNNKRRYK